MSDNNIVIETNGITTGTKVKKNGELIGWIQKLIMDARKNTINVERHVLNEDKRLKVGEDGMFESETVSLAQHATEFLDGTYKPLIKSTIGE